MSMLYEQICISTTISSHLDALMRDSLTRPTPVDPKLATGNSPDYLSANAVLISFQQMQQKLSWWSQIFNCMSKYHWVSSCRNLAMLPRPCSIQRNVNLLLAEELFYRAMATKTNNQTSTDSVKRHDPCLSQNFFTGKSYQHHFME